jgi:hypothetical protein
MARSSMSTSSAPRGQHPSLNIVPRSQDPVAGRVPNADSSTWAAFTRRSYTLTDRDRPTGYGFRRASLTCYHHVLPARTSYHRPHPTRSCVRPASWRYPGGRSASGASCTAAVGGPCSCSYDDAC